MNNYLCSKLDTLKKYTEVKHPHKVRPIYLSDNGPRPTYRGTPYKLIQDYGITIVWLSFYISWAFMKYLYTDYNNIISTAYIYRPTIIFLVRLLHSFSIYRNHFLSDKLHNHDKRYGEDYENPDKISIIQNNEKRIHAEDWVAALGICASHHILLTIVCLNPFKINFFDIGLLIIQITVMYNMYKSIDYELITPEKPLFKKFKITFAIQAMIFGFALFREYENNPLWLRLYSLVLIGLLCTGMRWPKRKNWGYHEILHCSVIFVNLCGILIDILKNGV